MVFLVDEKVGRVVEAAQQVASFFGGSGRRIGGAGLAVPDVPADLLQARLLVEVAVLVEEGGAKGVIVEGAAGAVHGSLALPVALHHPFHPLGRDGLGVLLHLHQDEPAVAAVLPVQVQHGVGGGAGAGERVEDDGIFICYLL